VSSSNAAEAPTQPAVQSFEAFNLGVQFQQLSIHPLQKVLNVKKKCSNWNQLLEPTL